MEINEHIIQVRGKATLLEPIERDNAYKLFVEGQIIDVREPSNDDGTVDRVYIFQLARAEIVGEMGKITRTKDSRRAHVKLRSTIRREWEISNSELSEEDFYQKMMSKIMAKIINGEITLTK